MILKNVKLKNTFYYLKVSPFLTFLYKYNIKFSLLLESPALFLMVEILVEVSKLQAPHPSVSSQNSWKPEEGSPNGYITF